MLRSLQASKEKADIVKEQQWVADRVRSIISALVAPELLSGLPVQTRSSAASGRMDWRTAPRSLHCEGQPRVDDDCLAGPATGEQRPAGVRPHGSTLPTGVAEKRHVYDLIKDRFRRRNECPLTIDAPRRGGGDPPRHEDWCGQSPVPGLDFPSTSSQCRCGNATLLARASGAGR